MKVYSILEMCNRMIQKLMIQIFGHHLMVKYSCIGEVYKIILYCLDEMFHTLDPGNPG